MSLLVFCRDGLLRVRKGVRHRAEEKHYRFDIPLVAMEERWPGMFLSLLDAPIELEDGLDGLPPLRRRQVVAGRNAPAPARPEHSKD